MRFKTDMSDLDRQRIEDPPFTSPFHKALDYIPRENGLMVVYVTMAGIRTKPICRCTLRTGSAHGVVRTQSKATLRTALHALPYTFGSEPCIFWLG